MTSNELRIGNLVTDEFYDSFKTIIKVDSIDERGINLEIEDDGNYPECAQRWIEPYYRLDTLRAIPITEEWLLKFGFVYRGIYYHFPNNDIFKLEQYKNKNSFWLRHGSESIDCTRINYVHQLQNLYFALTGEELLLKK